MRKALLAVTAFFVTVAATPATAEEFSFGGFMRFRFITGQPGTYFASPTVSGGFDEADSSVTFMEYRIRQFFNLKVNDHVTVNTKLEWNSFFGQQGGLVTANGDLQIPSETELRIKNAFVQFDMPGVPVTFTVGQQDFSTPKAIISVEDYTGVKAAVRAFGGEHVLFWARPQDARFETVADDGDWFGFVPSFDIGGFEVSPHISYLITHGATARLQDAEIWFFGVDASGKVGPVAFTADLIFQTGEFGTAGLANTSATPGPAGAAGTVPCTGTGTNLECDVFSYIVDASASLALGPGTLTAKVLYSPGDDNPNDSDMDAWFNAISTDLGWSPLFHDGTSISNFAGSFSPGLIGTDPVTGQATTGGGCICFGLEYALSPFKDLTVTPNVYYLMAAEDVNVAGGTPDDFYGIEAGVQANWRLWDSVVLLAQFDYLFAGDVFEDAGGNSDDTWRVVIGPSISW